MSTVAATNLKNASSSVNNAVTTSGGDLTNAAGVSFMGGSKNLLYNGAMQVAQRGTSSTGLTNGSGGYFTADRWRFTELGAPSSVWTQTVQVDAPSGSGFAKSLKMLCTTAQASPAAGDMIYIAQILEGQDLQRISKGTASAQQLSLSFWVKSNATGTYNVWLFDGDNTRSVSLAYTIDASATWERKTITFPADTTGAFDNDNAASLYVVFPLLAGTNFTSGTRASTWQTDTSANNAINQTNLAAATNNYWQITGVQLEIGPVATSFEFKSYGQELRECQRYYYRSSTSGNAYAFLTMFGTATATTNVATPIAVPVQMRTAPTSVTNGGNLRLTDGANVLSPTAVAVSADATGLVPALNWTVTGATQYRPYIGTQSNDSSAYIALSAEL